MTIHGIVEGITGPQPVTVHIPYEIPYIDAEKELLEKMNIGTHVFRRRVKRSEEATPMEQDHGILLVKSTIIVLDKEEEAPDSGLKRLADTYKESSPEDTDDHTKEKAKETCAKDLAK